MTEKNRNIALRLSYVGTNYHGWQEQKTEETVCGTLTRAVKKIFPDVTNVVGCGRTDGRVHALRYCANFKTSSTIPQERIPYALNSHLPMDIAVHQAVDGPMDFNAILSCVKKEYIYRIVPTRIRNPFLADRVLFYPRRLNVEAMKKAAEHFVGTHDFAAVRSVGTVTKTTVRTLHWFNVVEKEEEIVLHMCADGFLYNMARAMAGTLIYVSEGKIDPHEIPRLLETKSRSLTGPTVPPGGLYLNRLWYDGDVGRMFED